MTIAFVIRRCSLDLGHQPNASELAVWANHQDEERPRPFGRTITEDEAAAMLRNQDRLVSARSAEEHERHVEQRELPDNVISLSAARAQAGPRRHRR